MMSPINIISTIEIAHPDFVQMEFEKEINNLTIVSIIEERIPRKKKKIGKEWIISVTEEKKIRNGNDFCWNITKTSIQNF